MSGGTFDYIQYRIDDAVNEIRHRLKINNMTIQEHWDSLSDEEKESVSDWNRPWSMAPGKTPWWVNDEAEKVADKELGLREGDFSKMSDVSRKKWNDIRFEALRKIVDGHNSSLVGAGFKDETVSKIREMVDTIELAKVYINRIDWLFAGDDGEESFLHRTETDVNELTISSLS